VLTTYADDGWVLDAVRAGASGYLLKDVRRDDLLVAIKGTAAGKTFLDPSVAGKVVRQLLAPPEPPKPLPEALTERELSVLDLICRGYSNAEIAQRLHLASGTVRNYVSSILQKLDVEDRTQAAVMAYQRGLVRRTDPR
jgi:DNA-binding NarL/FixJ family response regulator